MSVLGSGVVAGVLVVVGVVVFMFGWHVAEFLYPGYSVSGNFISDLGATCRGGECVIVEPSASIFNSTVIFLGVMLLASSRSIHAVFKKIYVTVLIAVTGVGAVGVGAFPETAGVLHTIFSLVTFAGAGLAILPTATVLKPPMRFLSLALGLTTLAALVLFASDTYLGLGPGGMERLIVYPALMWALAFAGYLMRG
ncbi:MAG TPA: DUF998 domain-containing protein [Aigarchaeota archaeon]|nr:DUF998 domain-containing protein [Aigarchaeota archaeon]